MSSQPLIPMFSSDGSQVYVTDQNGVPGSIPAANLNDAVSKGGFRPGVSLEHYQGALASGAKMGLHVTSPDGQDGILPADKAQEAVTKGGFTLKPQFQPMAMTSPAGKLEMVPHEQAMDKLRAGYKTGRPEQQDKLGEQTVPQASADTRTPVTFHAPASSVAIGFSSGLGIPESQNPIADLAKSASGYDTVKQLATSGAMDVVHGNRLKGALKLIAASTPGIPQAISMLTPSVEQGKEALTSLGNVVSTPKDPAEILAATVNQVAPGKGLDQLTPEERQKVVDLLPAALIANRRHINLGELAQGLIHVGGMIPIVGPAAVGAGREIGSGIEHRSGDEILHGIGSGLGTVAGLAAGTEKGQAAAESAIGKTVRPAVNAITGPVSRAIVANPVSKTLGGGAAAMEKAPIPQQTAAGTATNAAVDQYAAQNGIRLLPGQATGAKGLKGIQAVGERAVVAPGELPDVLEGQKAAFGNLVDDFKERVGHPDVTDTETAGQNIKTQAQQKMDALKSSAQADYQGFQQATGDIPVDLSEVKAKAADALESQAEALKNVPAKYSGPIRGVLNKLANLQPGGNVDAGLVKAYQDAVDSYGLGPEQQTALRQKLGIPENSGSDFKMSTAQQLRSAYQDIARDYSGNVPKSVQRYAAQAARDIDAAMAKAADSVGATDQWRQANAKWKQLQQVYNDPQSPLYRILQEPSAVKVPGKVLGKGDYGGDPASIRTLKAQGIDVSPLKQEVAQQIAAKNFSLTNGGRGLGGYSMQFLGELFNPAELDELTKMGRVGRAIKFEMNPSGTSDVQAGERQLHGILARSTGALVGPLASRMTTSEWLARAARGAEPPVAQSPFMKMLRGPAPSAQPPGGGSAPPSAPGPVPSSPAGPGAPASPLPIAAAAEAAAGAPPRYAYRVRDVGETGIRPNSHSAEAGMDKADTAKYLSSRNPGTPQELVRVDLNQLEPHEYTIKNGPNGQDWVKFNTPVPEGFIEKMPDGKVAAPDRTPAQQIFNSQPQPKQSVHQAVREVLGDVPAPSSKPQPGAKLQTGATGSMPAKYKVVEAAPASERRTAKTGTGKKAADSPRSVTDILGNKKKAQPTRQMSAGPVSGKGVPNIKNQVFNAGDEVTLKDGRTGKVVATYADGKASLLVNFGKAKGETVPREKIASFKVNR